MRVRDTGCKFDNRQGEACKAFVNSAPTQRLQ